MHPHAHYRVLPPLLLLVVIVVCLLAVVCPTSGQLDTTRIIDNHHIDDNTLSQPPHTSHSIVLKKRKSSSQLSSAHRDHHRRRYARHDGASKPSASSAASSSSSHRLSHHHSHSSSSSSNKRVSDVGMRGSLFETYLMEVIIRNHTFGCIMDTGSSDFAVAASPSCGCASYYDGVCDGDDPNQYSDPNGKAFNANDKWPSSDLHLSGPLLNISYGDGNWCGVTCHDVVTLGSFHVKYTFAGMKSQLGMLECDEVHLENGIIGLAYQHLMGPPANYSIPFLNAVFQQYNLPPQFGLQCCGWSKENNAQHLADGALDIGGANKEHYRDSIIYTSIVREEYYAVDILDILLDEHSVFPLYYRNDSAGSPAAKYFTSSSHQSYVRTELNGQALPHMAEAIVDSGTSNIIVPSDIFQPLLKRLLLHEGISQELRNNSRIWSGDECIPLSVDISTWPTLHVVFPSVSHKYNAFKLALPPCRYLAKAPASECNGVEGWSFAIEEESDEGIIFGQALMEQYYIFHDLQAKRIGFALLDGCHDSSCTSFGKIQHVQSYRDIDNNNIVTFTTTNTNNNNNNNNDDDEVMTTNSIQLQDNVMVDSQLAQQPSTFFTSSSHVFISCLCLLFLLVVIVRFSHQSMSLIKCHLATLLPSSIYKRIYHHSDDTSHNNREMYEYTPIPDISYQRDSQATNYSNNY